MLPLIQAGRSHEAEALARRSYDRAGATGNRAVRGAAALWWGEAMAFRGLVAPGAARQLEAVALLRAAGHRLSERWACVFAALLLATVRDPGVNAVRTRIGELDAELVDPSTAGRWDHRLDFARAELAAGRADLTEAATVQERGMRAAGAAGALFEESYLGDGVVFFGDPARVRHRMTEIAAELAEKDGAGGGLVEMFDGLATAMAARDADGLSRWAQAVHDAGVEDYAVRAAACAAEAHAAGGDQRSARIWAGRSAAWMATCDLGNATTPVPLLLVEPLTAREREIADLAAAGATSRTIAERLRLSGRTVDNHLARAYDKLGIRSRSRLAEMIGGTGGYSTGRG